MNEGAVLGGVNGGAVLGGEGRYWGGLYLQPSTVTITVMSVPTIDTDTKLYTARRML